MPCCGRSGGIGYELILLAIACGFAATALAQTTTPTTAPDWIGRAIIDLGDPRADVRDAAQRKLWSAGQTAEPDLWRAANNADPEIAARARQVLVDFAFGLRPDTPPRIQEAIRQYLRGDLDQQQAAVRTMMGMGSAASPYLLKLSLAVPTQVRRADIFGAMLARPPQDIALALKNLDLAAVESSLQWAMLSGMSDAARSYAAFCTITGRGQATIAQLRQQLDLLPNSCGALQLLAYLYRCAGDSRSALQAARNADDRELLQDLLFETGDWKALAERYQADADSDDPVLMGTLAAYQRLAGDGPALAQTLAKTAQAQMPQPEMKEFAKRLLLNDQADAGIELLLKDRQFGNVFDLLTLRGDYQRAIDVAQKAITGNAPEERLLRAKLGRLRFFLGQRKEAIEIFDKLGEDLKQGLDGRAWAELVQAEALAHLDDRALEHAGEALSRLPEADAARVLGWLLHEPVSLDDFGWYQAFRAIYPNEPLRQAVSRAKQVHDRRLTPAELQRLAESVAQNLLAAGAAAHAASVQSIGKTLMQEGQYAVAQQILTRLAESTRADADFFAAGAAAFGAKQYQAAADLCARAASALPAAQYLQGRALIKAGDIQIGQPLVQAAALRGGPALPQALRAYAPLASLADELDALTQNSAQFGSLDLFRQLRRAAPLAAQAGDYSTAALYLERANFECLRPGVNYSQFSAYLASPHAAHLARAISDAKADDFDAAMKEAQACMADLPGSTEVVIALWPELQKAGRHADAQRLLRQSLDFHEGLLTKYPDSPSLHNSIAWMLARCHRDLEHALALSQKSVELDPDNPAFVDTLADVYLQLGQTQKAIELARRCVELDPFTARRKDRLKEFLRPAWQPRWLYDIGG